MHAKHRFAEAPPALSEARAGTDKPKASSGLLVSSTAVRWTIRSVPIPSN